MQFNNIPLRQTQLVRKSISENRYCILTISVLINKTRTKSASDINVYIYRLVGLLGSLIMYPKTQA